MRRLVWLAFLCLVLLLTVTGCTQPQQGVEGNLRWSLDRWGTLTIEGEGVIPDHFCSEPWGWDAVLSQATHLVIGEGVTEIGIEAFHSLPHLKTVELPEGLIRIGSSAFCHCSKLKNIALPDSIIEIGEYAFSGCHALTELRIPAGVTQISSVIISGNEKMRRLYLPARLESITDGTWACPALEEILVDEENPI